MDFQLGRHVIKDLGFVLANTILFTAATTAILLAGQDIEFMPVVRQFVEVEFPTPTTAVGNHLVSRMIWG